MTISHLVGLEGNTGGRRFYEEIGLLPDGASKSESWRGFVIDEIRYRIELGVGDDRPFVIVSDTRR